MWKHFFLLPWNINLFEICYPRGGNIFQCGFVPIFFLLHIGNIFFILNLFEILLPIWKHFFYPEFVPIFFSEFFLIFFFSALFQVEIFEGRSAFWFLGVGGTLVAILRGLIPEESQIRDPQKTMETIVQHTHYLPKNWRNNVHSYNVYLQFSSLFELKASLVISELLSVFLTPWILLVTLPRSAGRFSEISGDWNVICR